MPGLSPPTIQRQSHADMETTDLNSLTLSDAPRFPPLTRRAVDACAFPSWHPTFRRVSPKATTIPLTAQFIEYLHADGVFLPTNGEDSGSDAGIDPDASESEDEEDSPPRRTYDFTELSARIQEVIDEYGAVFPKLNWSSPQDAPWMVAGPPLKCTTVDDVYLLLKSSDFVTHDLDHAYDDCEDADLGDVRSPEYQLVLKKWFAMPRSHEFRCFVRGRRLIAISQRDTNYYDFLTEPSRRQHFLDLISAFFAEKIEAKFTESNYVLDIYITRDEDKVFLIDINPFASRTDSLLFSWDELLRIDWAASEEPKFRLVESEMQASQSMPAFSHNRYPQDVVGLSDGASIAEFAQNWRDAVSEAIAPDTGRHAGDIAGR